MKSRVVFSSASNEWGTPRATYEALDREFHFTLDPCPLGGTSNGLATLFTSWAGQRVWINPPYSDIRPWLERANEAEVAVYLIPARTDTRWFHSIILPNADEIRFICGRLRFGDAKNSAPFPSMIVVFRSKRRSGVGGESSENPSGLTTHGTMDSAPACKNINTGACKGGRIGA